jgi:phospholipid-translocating P-type ATPase (flippase)
MVFAQCDISGPDMGEFRGDGAPGLQKVKQVLSDGPSAGEAGTVTDQTFHNVVDFFTCLAVCHSVVKERRVNHQTDTEPPKSTGDSAESGPTGSMAVYSGASPDEVALVGAACQAGIKFKGRKRKYAGSSSELIIHGPGSKERVFVQLFELPFSSDRRCMSVIVRHRGDIWCITKGADTVMEPLLREPLSADCQTHLDTYAAKGLRTLIVGMKKVSQEEWEEWSAQYIAAREVINTTKESGMAEVAARIEKGLKFVGITAVDDRLQDQVPETIRLVKEMGIRLWVLTGDKTETAVDIARSCSLFTSSTTLAYAVKAKDAKDAEDSLLKAYSELEGKADAGIVLDGQTLLHALKSPECRKVIYDLGMVSRSCICARLSPQQKLQLVQLVREQDPKTITLSVGDGANDVPMIYGAHVGVAICGKEGTQAVQASDVAVSQFRFLMPLLQCHGRRAYRRVAMFLCFFLYKNITLIMLDIVWMFEYKFKGMVAVPEWLSINFNPIFTSLHMLLILGLDKDIPDEDANNNPALYKVGPARTLFNLKVFSKWVILGCYHGVICWTIPYMVIDPDIDNLVKTERSDFWVSSVTSFSCVVFVVCLKLMLVAQNPLGLHTWLPTLITFLVFFLAIFCFSYVWFGPTMQPNMAGMFGKMAANRKVFVSIFAVCLVALAPDVVMLVVERLFFPTELDKARRRSRQRASVQL